MATVIMLPTTFFATLVFTLFAAFALVTSAPLALRDVFVPHVLEPNVRSVWKIGNHYNVTWDITNAPKHITNKVGMIVLRNNGSLLLDQALATNFAITAGKMPVKVPNVPSGHYCVVVIGDSGNCGQTFKIEA